ncbi:MAG: hypothetical protein Sylvanvirus3_36 [Sylvanvirus sp.]|uniref:Uncharacterized protein n=1 Tax=Sylvanvirus sp. TaxID=2487774 RepID=A0A3G5AH93_9VIRU|nr:MAG: hypothetical protein Sylvanvirus3_36 [Sylvanvirus sp.]
MSETFLNVTSYKNESLTILSTTFNTVDTQFRTGSHSFIGQYDWSTVDPSQQNSDLINYQEVLENITSIYESFDQWEKAIHVKYSETERNAILDRVMNPQDSEVQHSKKDCLGKEIQKDIKIGLTLAKPRLASFTCFPFHVHTALHWNVLTSPSEELLLSKVQESEQLNSVSTSSSQSRGGIYVLEWVRQLALFQPLKKTFTISTSGGDLYVMAQALLNSSSSENAWKCHTLSCRVVHSTTYEFAFRISFGDETRHAFLRVNVEGHLFISSESQGTIFTLLDFTFENGGVRTKLKDIQNNRFISSTLTWVKHEELGAYFQIMVKDRKRKAR